MSTMWKEAIKNFLNDPDERTLRSQLRTEWVDIYPEEKDQIYRFLFHGRQHKLFIYLFAVDLQSQIIDLPWVLALKILTKHRVTIEDQLFNEIILNLKRQKLIGEDAKSITELISLLNNKARQNFLQRVLKTKQELIASARIAQSEQLIDQHVHYMNELKKISPHEYNVSGLISERDKQRADRIISKSLKRRSLANPQQNLSVSLEEEKIVSQLATQAKDFLLTKNVKATDLAFLFRSFGDHKKAIDFISQNESVEKKDWQLLDYLFAGKQFVSLLDHCQNLKEKYSQYPDALFAISYAESVAYWELGEKERAIDIMKQIASMRPDYKSATETLAQWKEDSFE